MHTYVHQKMLKKKKKAYNSTCVIANLESIHIFINIRLNKLWNVYTMEYYMTTKNQTAAICNNMGESHKVMLSERSPDRASLVAQ